MNRLALCRAAALAVASLAAVSSLGHAADLKVLTHPLAPFTIEDPAPAHGLAFDVVAEIMARTGDRAAITVTSFGRLMSAVQHGTATAGFIIARTPEREATIQWVGPLAVGGVYLYKKAGSPLPIATLADLPKLPSIAVQKGNADDAYLTGLGLANLERSYTQRETLQLVRNGRIPATPVSELVMPSLVHEAGLQLSEFERTPLKLYDSEVYIGFSPDVSPAVITAWSAALAAIRTSGRYDELVGRYRPTN